MKTLYPHQAEAAKFILDRPEGALLADAPGVGKTLSALGAAKAIYARTVLIVAPAALRDNWVREIRDFLPGDVEVAGETFPKSDIIVISYDGLERHLAEVHARHWDMLVCDEAHAAKNPKSDRRRFVFGDYASGLPALQAWRRVYLSGTAIPNGRPVELWNVLYQINRNRAGLAKSWPDFRHRYIGYDRGNLGARNLSELESRLSRVMLRRTLDDVLQLPPMTREVVDLGDVGSRSERVGNGVAKLSLIEEEIRRVLSRESSVVVFARHHKVLDGLRKRFDALELSGRTPDDERQKVVDDFQAGKKPVILCSTVGAQGFTLTRASTVVLAEGSYVPSELDQVEGRVRRIGQTRPTLSRHLIFGETDRHISRIAESKADNVRACIGD